ncbi:TPA: hypothetical protein ACH3X2_009573 [Trebouxia sp. C0005]
MRAIRSGRLEATCTVILVFGLWSIKCAFAQTAASATAQTGTTTVMMLTPHNDTGGCLQGCYNGDCGAGTNNYLSLATVCDERLSQLWLISSTNRQLVNVASGNCLSITADDVVILATCGNDSPAQTWTLFANGSLEAQSVPGEFLAVCATGAIGCDSKIMELISNDGQMVTVAAETDDTVASEGWEEVPPSTNGSLIHNFWGSTGTANASFSAAVAASAPWCMQRCSSSDCGDASLDASVVVSSICDERLGQMWYNDTSMIRSRLTDECLTICGISAADASDSEDNSSLAATCLGKGSDYYNVETRTCTGAANQLWEWITTTVGSVLFNVETNQAVTVCSDLEPWCGFLLLLGFDASWSARRLTGVQLPSNMSAITEFQTFSTAVLTKAQAGEIEPTVVNTSTPYTVPPAPEAPSEDTATIESVGTAEVVPDVAEPAPPPPPPAASSGVYGTFLPVTDTPPVSPTSQK